MPDTAVVLTKVENSNPEIIKEYKLKQNYPNPFNPITKINYSLPQNGKIVLKVYNMLGQEVRTLVNEFKTAGNYEVDFNASSLSSGVYIYRIEASGFSKSMKMVLLK